ncbi:MAG: hypothetical protein ACO3HC_01585 [Flavobacteriaceae bacterium]
MKTLSTASKASNLLKKTYNLWSYRIAIVKAEVMSSVGHYLSENKEHHLAKARS